MAKRLGIYIHIPFCASKCGYCDFYSLAGCEHLMPEYHQALLAHLKESAQAIKAYEVDSLYFGGGTPSFYGADRIADIFNTLKLNGNVRVDSEVTVECNPDSTSPNALKLLREEGVNRLSIGVQATDNNILKLIGRRHNFQQAQQTIQQARKAGFENINLDLIYGLPSQTKHDWAETLAKIVELHPEHISCYGLRLEEGTPMYEEYHGSPILPDDDEQADMYCYAAEMLSCRTTTSRRTCTATPPRCSSATATGSTRCPTSPRRASSRGTISNTGIWTITWASARARTPAWGRCATAS